MSGKISQVKEKIEVTIDTSVEDVLNYDGKGCDLNFEVKPGRFLKLDKEVIDKLSNVNRMGYYTASGINRALIDHEEVPPTPELKISPRYATATSRMDVITPPGYDKKWHLVWKRADEVRICRRNGYQIVPESDGVETFMDPINGAHVIGIEGNIEMILLKIPIEVYEAQEKANRDLSDRKNGAVDASARETIERLGGKPFIPKK